jgi:hypothetical protein
MGTAAADQAAARADADQADQADQVSVLQWGSFTTPPAEVSHPPGRREVPES